MKNTNYTIEFFHGLEGIWKPAGLPTFTTREEAKKVMKAQAEMTGYAVDFHIVEVAA